MCAQHTFCDRAGFEQAEAEQDGIADNAPDGADGIAGNRHVLYQHGIQYAVEKAIEASGKNIPLRVVTIGTDGNRVN